MRNIPRPRGNRPIATAALTPLALTGVALTLSQSQNAAAAEIARLMPGSRLIRGDVQPFAR